MPTRPPAFAALTAAALLVLAGCTSSGSGGPSTSSTSGTPTTSSASGTAPGSTSAVRGSSPASTSAGAPATAGPAVVHQKLTNFRIIDVTFVGTQAWALGSADCLSGKGVCDAIEYSGDGGRTWRSAPAPAAPVAALQHVRFATSRVGYVFGAHAFFTTADGGSTWRKQAGSAVALESAAGTTIRVTSSHSGCPGPCDVRVQTSSVGSSTWTTRVLPGLAPDAFVAVVAFDRSGGRAYLLITANPAGGGDSERSTLWTSADNGVRWVRRGEPCPQVGREVDSSRLTAAPDGSATVLCQPRGLDRPFTATSTDGGRSFAAGSRTALGSARVTGFAAASARVILICLADTFRSTDGGHRFVRLAANSGSSPGDPPYIGFASTSLGHAVTEDRTALETTTDGGATWQLHRIA